VVVDAIGRRGRVLKENLLTYGMIIVFASRV
jgi:hypothetical protein